MALKYSGLVGFGARLSLVYIGRLRPLPVAIIR